MTSRASENRLWFTMFLVGVPVVVHALLTGSYVMDNGGDPRTFWIGPISTTVPFVLLAVLFLAHYARTQRSESVPTAAFWGATVAWLAMIALTTFIVWLPPGPKTSSTMAIAVLSTPLLYIPILAVSYPVGAIAGRFWGRTAYPRQPTAT